MPEDSSWIDVKKIKSSAATGVVEELISKFGYKDGFSVARFVVSGLSSYVGDTIAEKLTGVTGAGDCSDTLKCNALAKPVASGIVYSVANKMFKYSSDGMLDVGLRQAGSEIIALYIFLDFLK